MRIKISRPIGCLGAIFLFFLLLSSPVIIETVHNEYKLYKFASQLDVVDDLLGDDGRKIGAFSERRGGSGSESYCHYEASRQYNLVRWPDKHRKIREKLDRLRFRPVSKRADGADAKFSYVLESWVLDVVVIDYETSMFDLKCQ